MKRGLSDSELDNHITVLGRNLIATSPYWGSDSPERFLVWIHERVYSVEFTRKDVQDDWHAWCELVCEYWRRHDMLPARATVPGGANFTNREGRRQFPRRCWKSGCVGRDLRQCLWIGELCGAKELEPGERLQFCAYHFEELAALGLVKSLESFVVPDHPSTLASGTAHPDRE